MSDCCWNVKLQSYVPGSRQQCNVSTFDSAFYMITEAQKIRLANSIERVPKIAFDKLTS